VAAGAGVAILAYLLYGAFYGWDLFTMVLKLQSSKWVGLRSVLDLVGISRVVELQFGGGWYLWTLIAVGRMAVGEGKRLLVPAGVYFLVLVASVDERGVFGWYRLPLYPYLCLAGGLFLAEWWQERDASRGFLFAATALATTVYYALPPGAERTRTAVLFPFAVSCLPVLLDRFHSSPLWSRIRTWGVALSLTLFFAGNVVIVVRQVPIYLAEGVRGKLPAPAGSPLGLSQPRGVTQGRGDEAGGGRLAIEAQERLRPGGAEQHPAIVAEQEF